MDHVKCWMKNGLIGKVQGFTSELPIKWEIVDDPIDKGTVLNSNDPFVLGGIYGIADIVTF